MITTRRLAVLSLLAPSCYGQGLEFIKSHYTKYEFQIPMRDGKRLFTSVYVPKDTSQPWANPETGARGSVTPLAQAYTNEGRTYQDFLASYVNGRSESWLQGAACQAGHGRWEIHTLKPWRRS